MPPHSSTHDVIAHYLWNMALCSALYAPLHSLEVALRNNLHAAATARYGGNERWFDSTKPHLTSKQRDDIVKAKAYLSGRGFADDGTTEYVGRIIAELNFSFWVIFFNGSFEPHFWDSANLMLQAVFRYLPPPPAQGSPRFTRKKLSGSLNRTLDLRNRIFHHEPIWRWHEGPIDNLKEQYEEMMQILACLDRPWRETIRCLEPMPFHQLFDAGPSPYLQHIHTIIPILYPPQRG